MINKFLKTIHSKHYKFFRFLFLIRYLFVIFFTASAIFLIIPNFFDYKKKSVVLKNYIKKNYGFKIQSVEKIDYKSFPIPKIEMKNVVMTENSFPIELQTKTLYLYPKLLSLYNYENFQANKVFLSNNNLFIQTSELKHILKQFFSTKNKLLIDKLNIKILNKENSLIDLNNLKFSNYGYNKNLIKGEVFDKKFLVEISNNLKDITFELYKTGIKLNINLDDINKKNFISGVIKSKILSNNLKFSFNYEDTKVDIYNSYFRSKNLSFKNKSTITLKPFLELNSQIEIEDANFEILKNFQIKNFLKYKEFIQKINSKNKISFISKKFSKKDIDEFDLKVNLAFGRLNYFKTFSISDHIFQCEGSINLLEEYPLLFFDCSIESDNSKNFFRSFGVKVKKPSDVLNLDIKGNLNLLNKKINLKKITDNKNYKATKEDLIYFKESFENILFDESFVEIFNYKKIKDFLIEIS